MEILYEILLATFIVGLIGLIGIVTLGLNKKLLEKVVYWLVAFSAGTLLGGAFFHLMEESLQILTPMKGMLYLMAGFVGFYLLERLLFWHHCHNGICDVRPTSYLVLVGDSLHNMIDGIVIAASFMVNISFGWLTTAIIISHEIPQEMGNFAILIYSKMNKFKALFMSFCAQLTAVIGGLIGYFIGDGINTIFLLPIAAGGFVYISASDLIPSLKKDNKHQSSVISFILFILGVLFMLIAKIWIG